MDSPTVETNLQETLFFAVFSTFFQICLNNNAYRFKFIMHFCFLISLLSLGLDERNFGQKCQCAELSRELQQRPSVLGHESYVSFSAKKIKCESCEMCHLQNINCHTHSHFYVSERKPPSQIANQA